MKSFEEYAATSLGRIKKLWTVGCGLLTIN